MTGEKPMKNLGVKHIALIIISILLIHPRQGRIDQLSSISGLVTNR